MILAVVLASPAVILLISITRLLIVCNYQTSTAVAVAATSGAVTTLLGTLIPLVPLFLPYVTLLLVLASIRYALGDWEGIAVRFLIGSGICLIATLFVTPTTRSFSEIGKRGSDFIPYFRNAFVAMLIGFMVVLVIVGLFSRNSRSPTQNINTAVMGTLIVGFWAFVVLAIVVAAFIALFAYPLPKEATRIPELTRKVWLPAEQLDVKERGQVVGYVLSTEEGWFTVLVEADRTVIRIKSDDIDSRQICRLGSPDGLPLIRPKAASIPTVLSC